MLLGLIALVTAAIFFGAAFYINFAEHTSRMGLTPDSAVRQWAPAYNRGYMMQGGLALISGVAGLTVGWTTGNGNWLAGGLFMLANGPWTTLAIMPVNRKLTAIDAGNSAQAEQEVKGLLCRWCERHTVRTCLAAMAITAYIFAITAW